ncbi:MAG: hypothetical protein ACOC8N_06755 [Spirochaetota bacterium]
MRAAACSAILILLLFPSSLRPEGTATGQEALHPVEEQAEPGEGAEGDPAPGDDVRKIDIKASAVRARVNPQFEFVLPTGDISQHFIMHFNYLELTFDLSAGLVDNTIDGEVTFAYPLNRIRPYVSFVQKVDFENYLDPQISGRANNPSGCGCTWGSLWGSGSPRSCISEHPFSASTRSCNV